jgi:hypothetical protein
MLKSDYANNFIYYKNIELDDNTTTARVCEAVVESSSSFVT